MKAFVFPGQGAQFVGMGKDLYENNALAKEMFEKANEVLGFRITDIMFAGTEEELKQTKVTQPAIFLHSVILAKTLGEEFKPDMVAGHSLGEFSALVAAGALSFEEGLKLVATRAMAMQKACEVTPSTMAAVLALPNEKVEEICASIDDIVAPANYNCPGQVVISGTVTGIDAACPKMLEAGANDDPVTSRGQSPRGRLLLATGCALRGAHLPCGCSTYPQCYLPRSAESATWRHCRGKRAVSRRWCG